MIERPLWIDSAGRTYPRPPPGRAVRYLYDREEISAQLRRRAERLEREVRAMRVFREAAADFDATMERVGEVIRETGSRYRLYDEGQGGVRAVDPLPYFERHDLYREDED